jgi:hypothetical protein
MSQKALENVVMKTLETIEAKIDDALEKVDNVSTDELAEIRKKRLQVCLYHSFRFPLKFFLAIALHLNSAQISQPLLFLSLPSSLLLPSRSCKPKQRKCKSGKTKVTASMKK